MNANTNGGEHVHFVCLCLIRSRSNSFICSKVFLECTSGSSDWSHFYRKMNAEICVSAAFWLANWPFALHARYAEVEVNRTTAGLLYVGPFLFSISTEPHQRHKIRISIYGYSMFHIGQPVRLICCILLLSLLLLLALHLLFRHCMNTAHKWMVKRNKRCPSIWCARLTAPFRVIHNILECETPQT